MWRICRVGNLWTLIPMSNRNYNSNNTFINYIYNIFNQFLLNPLPKSYIIKHHSLTVGQNLVLSHFFSYYRGFKCQRVSQCKLILIQIIAQILLNILKFSSHNGRHFLITAITCMHVYTFYLLLLLLLEKVGNARLGESD